MPASIEAANVGSDDIWFAGYPAPYVFSAPDGKTKVEQTIWGDYVGIKGPLDGKWVEVRARGANGWMRRDDLQRDRLLELNFVDVGQGDGCFIVTPQDEKILIDAGEADNMLRFLSWRFNLRAHRGWTIPFKAGVLSHGDSDHYYGFSHILDSGNFSFDVLYHNGLVERKRKPRLGPHDDIDDVSYQTEVIETRAQLQTLLADDANVGTTWYARLLKTAVEGGAVRDVVMLSTKQGFVPGYEDGQPVSIEVLGPVPESKGGRTVLRRLGDDGVTKNGHSVILRMRYGGVTLLLGGDLNDRSQQYLLQHYTGVDADKLGDDDAERQRMIERGRSIFGADVAKSCHHGSGHFIDEFLGCVNALATVVSSGDDESYAHPRPDALGALGRWGRGPRPLIFSTELARSSKENIKQVREIQQKIKGLTWEQAAAGENELALDQIQAKIDQHEATLERAVAVYGLINVRTDGEKVLLAQKLERPAGRGRKWDVHLLEPDQNGDLHYVSGHD